MSQVITNAFEQYWQSSLAAEQPVVLDEFILADIPNLDITAPIDPDTGLPPESQIVHRQNVDQRGRINNNAVAYTIVMDTTVGDFSFNAMYLRNKANGVIGMIVYKGRETKLKTDQTTGQTGNSLVKSMLMGYDQAAEATLTHVDAGTWQIDYAARLRGQDEDLRQLASQLYGHHTFIGDGFKVVQQAGGHQVTQGVAIVGGLRIELKQPEVIYPGTKPIGVWVDVHRAGSLLSEHQNHFTIITSVADLTDHVDSSGYQHYVAKLGIVQADNTVVDGRGQGGSSGSGVIPDTFALWMRSMAEAGYNVTGSFELGGTVTTAKDVLICEADGKAYSSSTLPMTVPKNSSPAAGWTVKSAESLREQLAANAGSELVGFKLNVINSILRTLYDVSAERISVKNFNVKGNGIVDDTAAIAAACAALQAMYEADGVRRTLVFPDGGYRTSSTVVVHNNMRIDCSGRVTFQNAGTDKSFPAIELQGGGKKSVLGTMDSYGAGILIRGSIHTVEFNIISNCIDGVIFRADTNWAPTTKSLDNIVRGAQIGRCTNAIVFEQNANSLTQQGNEVRVNFVSETNNTCLFRNFGGFIHTQQSNWDSNFVELMASDPLTLPDSSMVRNSTQYSVSNLTFSVRTWCGGWVPDAETMCLIRGGFFTSHFTFSLATRIGLNEVVDAAGKTQFGSCMFIVTRYDNLGVAASYYQSVPVGAEFNGGIALYRSKFKIRVAVPDLAAGQTFGSSFWHVNQQASSTGRVRLEQYADTARGKYLIELRDAGAEQKGLVRIWITNIKTTTVTGNDVDLIISAF